MIKRVRKESDLPEKKWGSPSIQQKYSHTKLTQRSSAVCFVEFSNRCARLKMTWHTRNQWIACALEMLKMTWHTRDQWIACALEMCGSNGCKRPSADILFLHATSKSTSPLPSNLHFYTKASNSALKFCILWWTLRFSDIAVQHTPTAGTL